MTPPRGARTSVTVEIAGEQHVIRSDAAPEYTHSVAAHVDSAIRTFGRLDPLEPHRNVILAAMVITDELFRVREELRVLREDHARRTVALAERLERSIGVRLSGVGADVPPEAAGQAPDPVADSR